MSINPAIQVPINDGSSSMKDQEPMTARGAGGVVKNMLIVSLKFKGRA